METRGKNAAARRDFAVLRVVLVSTGRTRIVRVGFDMAVSWGSEGRIRNI
jgi:hypothetical protein